MMLVFEKVITRIICARAQVGRSDCEKDLFYNVTACEWGLQNPVEMILGPGDFNRYVEGRIDGFEGAHGGNRIDERMVEGRRLLKFCDEKELCVANMV